MGTLTLMLLGITGLVLVHAVRLFMGRHKQGKPGIRKIRCIRSMGLLALITGLLGQLIGLFSAFRAFELGTVKASPSLVAEGFKVSMITAVYGGLIFVFSMLVWWIMRRIIINK